MRAWKQHATLEQQLIMEAITAALSFVVAPVAKALCRHPMLARYWFQKETQHLLPLFRLSPPQSLVPNKRLEDPIKEALLYRPRGVHVLYAPADHGKSTAVRHAIRSLQSSGALYGCLDMLTNNIKANQCHSAVEWVNASLGIKSSVANVSDLVPAKWRTREDRCVTLLCDQFERVAPVCDKEGPDVLAHLVCGLALNSLQTKAFNAIIVVKDKDLYTRILGFNDNKKIRPVHVPEDFSWLETELAEVLDMFVRHGDFHLKPEERSRILLSAFEAGNIGALVSAIGNIVATKERFHRHK